MQHEQRRRPAFTLQRLCRTLAAFVAGQQILVSVHEIAVRGGHVAVHPPARFGPDPDDLVTARFDFGNRIAEPNSAAQPLKVRDHRRNQPVGAALGKPHAAFFFDGVDQRINGAGTHRIAADKQGVKR